MSSTVLRLLVVVIAYSIATNAFPEQEIRLAVIHPPNWLHGCWHDSLESLSSRFETYNVSESDIVRTDGFPGTKTSLAFAYQGYEVEEHSTDNTYCVTFSNAGYSYSYEFIIAKSMTAGEMKLPVKEKAIGVWHWENDDVPTHYVCYGNFFTICGQ